MAALNNAVQPAVPIWSDAQNVQGSVATPEFPGPISTSHAASLLEVPPGSPAGPVAGTSTTVPYWEHIPIREDIPGELGDTAAIYGHAAPQATFDSNAGNQYGSGPIADTHGFDTGGTRRTQHVIEPKAPGWWRRTLTGQTWNRTVTYDPAGKIVSEPNNRQDMDQYQGHNANASEPRWIPYGERPIKLNIAHEPVPVGTNQDSTAYTPAIDLSPVGPLYWTDKSVVYETPADPVTTTIEQNPAAPPAAVGFWS